MSAAPDPGLEPGRGRPDALSVCLTVDVEEEGLFCGRYDPRPAPPRSPAHLERLAILVEEHHLPVTLLSTHAVLSDPASRGVLSGWHAERRAELGLHLHPWSTPPFTVDADPNPLAPTRDQLAAKLDVLAALHREHFGFPARAFRMGRFDFRTDLPTLLGPVGIRVDSSSLPLGWARGGPPQFLGPADPYALADDLAEVPLTMVPVIPGSDRLAERLARGVPGFLADAIRGGFRYVLAAGTQPTMYALPAMQLAATLHRARGGRVLTLHLHSSELMPGASPLSPDARAVDRLVERMRRFLDWVAERWGLVGTTLSEAGALASTATDRCATNGGMS